MATIHAGVTGRAGSDQLEPLAVSPRQTCLLLNIGNTRLYELIRNGELDTYREGRARRITMESIRHRVERLLADAGSADVDIEAALPRRRQRRTRISHEYVRRGP
jgi:excisionase family DNA binding protein